MTIIPTFQNVLIRASAGTGKTYQLSNRYLGLLARGSQVDSILASTFTRKAAGEIMNRILLRIAEAAADEKKRKELAEAIGVGLTEPQCFGMLRRMTENLHRIHVHTLDGFFSSLATCFPYELGLAPGWRVMDDAENEIFVRDAIRQVLAEDPDSAVRIMRGLTRGQTHRNIQRQVMDLLGEMYEKTLPAPAEAWQKVEKIPLPRMLDDAELGVLLGKIQAWADVMDAETDDSTSLWRGTRKQSFTGGLRGMVESAGEENWRKLLENGLIKKSLEADKLSQPLTYYAKEVPGELATGITQLAFHVSGTLLRQYVQQTYATQKMMERFHVHYEALKQKAKVVRFADITRRLAQFITDEAQAAMMLRLDAGVDHLLLDEFQDTSVDQWNILKPLGRRCTTAGSGKLRTFFCVGDMKQAIYAWRGGKAAIFGAVTGALDGIMETPLDRSFRSSPVVIYAVNRIFEQMGAAIKEEYLPGWEKWANYFHPHQTAKTDYPGYWEVRTAGLPDEDAQGQGGGASADEEENLGGVKPKQDEVLKTAAEEVKKLYENAGGNISVGILMRRRKPVTRMMTHLQRLGIQASEEVGNPLTNSQAVRLVLSVMKLVDHPDDRVSWFHVAHSPLAAVFPALEWNSPGGEKPERKAWLSAVRERLVTDGYGKVVEYLARCLMPYAPQMDVRRLEQLQELAAGYEARKTLRTADFVRFVEKTPLADPTAANVRVMTIHQAKGLQFDAVFLPDLDFSLAGAHTPDFVVGYPRNDETAPPKLVTRYIPEPLRLLLPPEFQEAFTQEKYEQVEEGLCTLYVALTRAIHGLYIIVPPEKPSEKDGKVTDKKISERNAYVAKILVRALAEAETAPPEKVLASGGKVNWWAELAKKAEKKTAPAPKTEKTPVSGEPDVRPLAAEPGADVAENAGQAGPYVPLRSVEAETPIIFAPGRKFGRGLRRRTPSQAEERLTIDLEKTMHFRASSATRGTVVHAWFEKIGWLEYCSPADDELCQIARQNGLDEDMIHRSLQEFHNAMKNEKIRAVLSWEKYLPKIRGKILATGLLRPEQVPVRASLADDGNRYQWKVYCEKELAVRTEKEFLLGTIDRLVLLWEDDRVIWADCFDYKTSKRLPPEILEEKVAKHRLQLLDYREMLHRHYLIPKEQISAHLIFPMMGVVREV